MIRYCPECGHIGPIDNTKHIDCCPDGNAAMDVPLVLIQELQSAKAMVASLEAWRADAALGLGASRVEALREARDVLGMCSTKPTYPKNAPEYEPIRALCERHGYGAVMACASSQWMEMLEREGYPMEGAHTSGPCAGTVTSTINHITHVLGE